jgi:phenylacetate-CoA ligase
MRSSVIGNEYQIIIDKKASGDDLIIIVESSKKLNDNEKKALAKDLEYQLKEVIIVTPKIEIVDPGTLPRFDGKAKRVMVKVTE